MRFLLNYHNKRLLFFSFSLLAVVIDCSTFQTLTICNLNPFSANFISSCFAVSINYFLTTMNIFIQLNNLLGYILFLSWYMISIFLFSKLLILLVTWTHLAPLICKISILPISFLTNFYFISFLAWIIKNDESNNDIYSNI